MNFVGKAQPLTEVDAQNALSILGMDTINGMPLLWALLEIESRGFGFLRSRQPKILFERHVFSRETNGRFNSIAPDLSAKTGGGYLGGAAEFDRLARALELCQSNGLGSEPALRSASWGLGQVMGFNAGASGFKSAGDMAAQMTRSEGVHLSSMVAFMKSQGLEKKLQAHDWAGFARRYNGSAYWKKQYDLKLKAAFEKFASGVTRDLRARSAQGALLFLGYKPGEPDGVVGQNTRRAIVAFRRDHNMGSSEELDDPVFEAIFTKAGFDLT